MFIIAANLPSHISVALSENTDVNQESSEYQEAEHSRSIEEILEGMIFTVN